MEDIGAVELVSYHLVSHHFNYTNILHVVHDLVLNTPV